MVAAFSKLSKVGTSYGANPTLCRQLFNFLTSIYLPLVPGLKHAHGCLTPLLAAAKLGYWNSPLPTAVLRKLGAESNPYGPGPVEPPMLGATEQEHAILWQSLARAPHGLVAYAEPVLEASAAGLMVMPTHRLGSQACATILLAASRLRWRHRPLLDRLTACLGDRPDAKNQELANALYALGNLAADCGHVPRGQDLRQIAVQVVQRLRTKQGTAATAGREPGQQYSRGFASAQVSASPSPPRQRGGAAASAGSASAGNSRGGASGARPGQVVGDARGSASGSNLEAFAPLDLSQMLLGCSKLGGPPAVLLEPLAAAAGGAAGRMSEQQLSNCLSALAKLGCTQAVYAPAVEGLCAAVHGRMRGGRCSLVPQDISSILWALEGLRPAGHQELAEALAGECLRRRFAGFNTQDLCQAVWALSKMGWVDQDWYEAAVEAASESGAMVGAKPQEWSSLWYALGLVRHRPKPSFLAAMVGPEQPDEGAAGSRGASALEAFSAVASAQACSNTLWALAVLGLYDQRLVDALARRLQELLGSDRREVAAGQGAGPLAGQHLTGSLWALAAMGPEVLVRHGRLVVGLLAETFRRWESPGRLAGSPEEFGVPELRQLGQVETELAHLAADKGASYVQKAWSRAPKPLLHALSRVRKDVRSTMEPEVVQVREQVVRCLRQLRRQPRGHTAAIAATAGAQSDGADGSGWPSPSPGRLLGVQLDEPMEGLGWRVDVLVELSGGRQVGLLVDGPSQFLRSQEHLGIQHGGTRLRDRQMGRLLGAGNLLVLPYQKWVSMQEERDRQAYLCGLFGLTAGEQ